jgi:site-specific recombinase XerD
VFGHAKTGEDVSSNRSAWETLLLLSHEIEPAARSRGHRRPEHDALRKINLHWHDLRHHAARRIMPRLADEGVPVHELQMLAGHASITTTQRYMNARANALAESMRQARERRADRLAKQSDDNVQVS